MKAETFKYTVDIDKWQKETNAIITDIVPFSTSSNSYGFMVKYEESPEIKTVRRLISEHMYRTGYDGLYNSDGGCGCRREDLLPCELSCLDCKFGYVKDDPSGEHDFIVSCNND